VDECKPLSTGSSVMVCRTERAQVGELTRVAAFALHLDGRGLHSFPFLLNLS